MTKDDEFKITDEQLANLDQLVCERFSGSASQLKIIQAFAGKNEVAAGLVKSAVDYASAEDKSKIAYYLIHDKDGVGYVFFSLRAGLLFDYEASARIEEEMSAAEEKRKIGEDTSDISKINAAKRTSCELKDAQERLYKDFDSETRKEIMRVKKTFSGVELVHFCRNESVVDRWRSMKPAMGTPVRRMGEVLFWHFVVPKILHVLDVIGAEVIYLFAADSTDDEKLRKYYKRLGFKRADENSEYACLKDSWEWESFFMHREVTGLAAERDAYFRDFNQSVL